jgi:penicillin-insensitive murein endopeptidase
MPSRMLPALGPPVARSANFGLVVWVLAFVAAPVQCALGDESGAPIDPWGMVGAATRGRAEAIGSPDHGCLAGAARLPLDGPGYEVVHPERRRYFGHPDMIDFVAGLARRAQAAGLPLLYVGDMAQARGGPIVSSDHHSHETGLDVDLWFTFGPKYSLTPAKKESPDPRSMLQAGNPRVDPTRFGSNQMTLLRFALADPRVERILVNPAIKLALCRGVAGANWFGKDWLRRLQPWSGHDDHFHVRLRCPETSHACEPSRTPVPDGDGCDAASVNRAVRPAPKAPPAPPPSHSAACQRLLMK